jgi:hypothetical protein
VVKRTFFSRLLPTGGFILSAIWLILTWQCWTAEAAFRQVYPDLRLRDLAAPPAELARQEEVRLVTQAAASVPASADYQWGLADRLVHVAYPAAHGDPDQASAVINDAIRAYIRSLWSTPRQPHVLFAILQAADEVYVPDNGPEPDILIDLADRANRLAPYNAGLRLDIADWYLSQWQNLTPATRARVVQQVEATLRFAETHPEVREQHKQTTVTLQHLLETNAARTAQEEELQPPRTPSSPSTSSDHLASDPLGTLGVLSGDFLTADTQPWGTTPFQSHS